MEKQREGWLYLSKSEFRERIFQIFWPKPLHCWEIVKQKQRVINVVIFFFFFWGTQSKCCKWNDTVIVVFALGNNTYVMRVRRHRKGNNVYGIILLQYPLNHFYHLPFNDFSSLYHPMFFNVHLYLLNFYFKVNWKL